MALTFTIQIQIITFHMVRDNGHDDSHKSYYKMLVAICTKNSKYYIEQKKKKKCELKGLLVLSGNNLPQCTAGDLSVFCTIHHFGYKERKI